MSHTCRWVFPHHFLVLPNLNNCFYNLIKTQRKCFQFLLENTVIQKRKWTCLWWSSKCKFSLLTPSLCQHLVLVLCFYWVIEHSFKPISVGICFELFSNAIILYNINYGVFKLSSTTNNIKLTYLYLPFVTYQHVRISTYCILYFVYAYLSRIALLCKGRKHTHPRGV